MSMKSALRINLSASYVIKSITSISHLRWLFPPLVPYATKGGMHFLERSEVGLFPSGEARLYGFSAKGGIKNGTP